MKEREWERGGENHYTNNSFFLQSSRINFLRWNLQNIPKRLGTIFWIFLRRQKDEVNSIRTKIQFGKIDIFEMIRDYCSFFFTP